MFSDLKANMKHYINHFELNTKHIKQNENHLKPKYKSKDRTISTIAKIYIIENEMLSMLEGISFKIIAFEIIGNFFYHFLPLLFHEANTSVLTKLDTSSFP
jgi:hypothetical protein